MALNIAISADPNAVAVAVEHLGATGFTLRSTGKSEGTLVLFTAAARTVVPPTPVRVVAKTRQDLGLSAIQIMVLEKVAEGMTNAEIGAALGKADATIKSHLQRAFKRLGTGDRAEAVLIGLRAGIIGSPR